MFMSIDKIFNQQRCVDKIKLFSQLTEAQKQYLLDHAISYKFYKDEWIDQLPRGIYILHQGNLNQISTDMQTTISWHEGDVIGEHQLLENHASLSFEAQNNGELCIITKESIMALIEHDHSLAIRLIKVSQQQIQHLKHRIYTLSIKDTTKKIAQALLDLQQHNLITLSHQKIADYCQLTRETVTRKLQYLVKNNMIMITRTSIEIIDKQRLQQYIQK